MIRVAAGILQRDGRILLCQRKSGGPHPLKWEFPGGKLREGENAEAALCRELREELGVLVPPSSLRSLEILRHRYPGGPDVEIHFFEVSGFSGEMVNLSFQRIAWVASADLPGYDFLEADRRLVARIAAGGVLSRDGSPPGPAPVPDGG